MCAPVDMVDCRRRLECILPHKVGIDVDCSCSCEVTSMMAVWPGGRRKECRLCCKRKTSVHAQVGRYLAVQVVKVDPGALIFPEFGFVDKKVVGKSGVHYVADMVVVFSSGKVLSVEIDGDSHENRDAQHADSEREQALMRVGIETWRVNFRDKVQQHFDIQALLHLAQGLARR